jgi:hypothetical protein
MDQKAIVLCLYMRGMVLNTIHKYLMRVFGENAVAYSTVTKYVRSERLPPKNDGPPSEPINVEPGAVDQAILTAFADDPFSSVREFLRLTCLPRFTVHRHLTDSLHFRIQHLRWSPRLLTPKQKLIQVNTAGESLLVLSVQGARPWHDLVTLDESWFDLSSQHDLMWTGPGEIVPTENDTPFNRGIHGDNCLESEWLPRCESAFKVEQIQFSILCQQYPCSNLRLQTIELENVAEQVVAPCGQLLSRYGKSVDRLYHP